MSLRSTSTLHRFCLLSITALLLTACAGQATPTATPMATPTSIEELTTTPTPRPTSTPTPEATSTPTATPTPRLPKPTATPQEVAREVEFAIERKTVEAPDGSKLEVVGWSTGRLGIFFEKEFADKAYTFRLDGSKKEAGAVLMPDRNVSWEEIQGRFENLVTVVVGAKLRLVDTSKPIPRAKLEEIEKYLAEHPDASYEVRSGGKVPGRVKANAPIKVVFVKPKLKAERTMKWDFPKDEAAAMAPFTADRTLVLDEGRGEHYIGEEGELVIVFEELLSGNDETLMSMADYWQLGLVTVLGFEAGGGFDIANFRGQAFDLPGYQGFRGTVPLGSGFWRPAAELYRVDSRPPKDSVLDWGRP